MTRNVSVSLRHDCGDSNPKAVVYGQMSPMV